MAYADQEGSIQDGAPYFLYEFVTSESSFRYVNHAAPLNWNSYLWNPSSIKHSSVKQSTSLSKNSMKITLPLLSGDDFINLFIGWAPDQAISYTLRRGHFGSEDTVVYWKGRVSSHKLKNEEIELTCESIFTSLRRSGVRARFQRNCRHRVYGVGCNLDKDDFAILSEIISVDGVTVIATQANSEPDGWFTGGAILFPDGSYRTIKSHIGQTLIMDKVNRFITDNLDYSGYGNNYGRIYGEFSTHLIPGCNRTMTTCLSKFNNLDNYGGFKWIPNKNPMAGSSIL